MTQIPRGIRTLPPTAVTRDITDSVNQIIKQGAYAYNGIDVRLFGAKGDTTTGADGTDDTVAIQAALTYLRSLVVNSTTVLPALYIRGNFRVTAPLDATVINGISFLIAGPGCIWFNHNSTVGIDFSCTKLMTVRDMTFQTASGSHPGVGVLRAANNSHDAVNCTFERVAVVGTFDTSCMHNYGAEDNSDRDCLFWNQSATAANYAASHDGTNGLGITSTFVTLATSTQRSNNTLRSTGCTYAKSGGAGPALFTRATYGHRILNAYFSSGDCGVIVDNTGTNNSSGLEIDGHFEVGASGLTTCVRFTGESAQTLQGFKLTDGPGPQATTQILEAGSGVSLVTLSNVDIDIPKYQTTPSNGVFSARNKFKVLSGTIRTPEAATARDDADQHPGWVSARRYFFDCATSASAIQVVENRLYFYPLIVPLSQSGIDKIGFAITVGLGNASAQAKVGIYRNAGGIAGTLISDAGFITVGTGTGEFLSSALALSVPTGVNWLCVIFNSNGGAYGTGTVRSYSADAPNLLTGIFGDGFIDSNTIVSSAYADVVPGTWGTYVLPTTAPAWTYAATQSPIVGIKAT